MWKILGRGFGVLFVFGGSWEGIRNRKGCGCVWEFRVFGLTVVRKLGCPRNMGSIQKVFILSFSFFFLKF